MTRQYPKMSGLIRLGAAVSLSVWMLGFLFCQTECLSRSQACHTGSESTHHDQSESGSPCHSEDEGSSSEHDLRCCCAIQVVKQEVRAPAIFNPLTYVLVLVHSAEFKLSSETDFGSERSYFHAEHWREWTSTPEVCLGPAIHSLAPPQSSFLV